ncbi:MAG: trimeric intracellular cation channel family protein [Desulfovibrionaceae bacterium]|nr:trimeric intracellular cation channel family protein [Desulfovibrionaceae bacterium]
MESVFLYFMDIIGTVAFAASGSMLAVRKNMDLLGIIILGLVTAVGGGAVRDVLIGRTPPVMFANCTFVVISLVTSCMLFFILRMSASIGKRYVLLYGRSLFWFDTLGLAAFTVDGVMVGISFVPDGGWWLFSFLGVITGVGGGLIRDVLAQEMPMIFVRHVYACASMAGAFVTVALHGHVSHADTLALGFATVVIIRVLSAKYRWNLPRIEKRI